MIDKLIIPAFIMAFLQELLIALKLSGVMDSSWGIVFIPTWTPIVLCVVTCLYVFTFYLVYAARLSNLIERAKGVGKK